MFKIGNGEIHLASINKSTQTCICSCFPVKHFHYLKHLNAKEVITWCSHLVSGQWLIGSEG